MCNCLNRKVASRTPVLQDDCGGEVRKRDEENKEEMTPSVTGLGRVGSKGLIVRLIRDIRGHRQNFKTPNYCVGGAEAELGFPVLSCILT